MNKKKEVVLNSHQLHELKWFCKNVTGTRLEFYDALDEMMAFKSKLDRLFRTCELVEKFLKDMGEDHNIEPFEKIDWTKPTVRG